MTERQAQTNRPYQNADIVGLHQRGDGVRYHAHQQAAQHLGNTGRRRDFGGAYGQRQRLRREMAKHHRDHRREKGAQQIERDNGFYIGFLALLVISDRRTAQ